MDESVTGQKEENIKKVQEMTKRFEGMKAEDDDLDFLTEQTFRRYLQARDWNLDHAEKLLTSTVVWRKDTKPQHVACTYCQARPGVHSMRHVGFDRFDRPVLYANFAQCVTQHHHAEDSLQHMIYLTENATRAMAPHVHQFVWVLDFTGMKVSSCNPHIAYTVEQVVSYHYPERLGACVCVNHGVMFQAFWQTIKHFVPPATAKKVHAERHHHKVEEVFTELFPDELRDWLLDEMRLNKLHPVPKEQKEFWKARDSGHDPRGCNSYVEKYIVNFPKDEYSPKKLMYLPHPNILKSILEQT